MQEANTETPRAASSMFPGGERGAGGNASTSKNLILTLICMSYWAPPGRDMVAVICSLCVGGRATISIARFRRPSSFGEQINVHQPARRLWCRVVGVPGSLLWISNDIRMTMEKQMAAAPPPPPQIPLQARPPSRGTNQPPLARQEENSSNVSLI
jgi:hypothetical protein